MENYVNIENKLVGMWFFKEANILFSFHGIAHNAKKEKIDLTSLNQAYKGMSFIFTHNTCSIKYKGQSSPFFSYSLSEEKLFIEGDGLVVYYCLSDMALDLTFTRDVMEIMMGDFPDEFDIFDYVKYVLSFSKIIDKGIK